MKAAIYSRVSTDDQEREGTSLDSQVSACLTKARELGYDVSDNHIFRETYSGLTLDRPLLGELRQRVISGEIDGVIAYTLDRLSRDPVHFIILQDELERFGVSLVLVTEDIDSSDMGKLIMHIKGYAAKLEAEKIRERTQRGKHQKLEQGQLPHGTGYGLYGYTWDKENKVRVVNELEAKIVEKIFRCIADGMSKRALAAYLTANNIATKTGGVWHPYVIHKMVRNKSYIGETYEGDILLPNITPPIIDSDLFREANEALDRNYARNNGKAIAQYLLTGHLFCGYCNGSMSGTMVQRKFRYYRCLHSNHNRDMCTARRIRADNIESIVWDKIKGVILREDVIKSQLQTELDSGVELQISKLKHRMKTYPAQKKRITSLFRYGDIIDEDTLLDELNRIESEWEADEARISELSELKKHHEYLASVKLSIEELADRVKGNIDNLSFEDKRLMLWALDIKVVATQDRIEINGNIPVKLSPATPLSA
jgi:site-specific DNA recombinase